MGKYIDQLLRVQANLLIFFNSMLLLAKSSNEEQETNRTSIPQPSEQVTSSRIGPIEESIDIMNARSKGSAKGDDSARSRMSDPTIVLCNPNAGIYEFMYYEVKELPLIAL